MRRHEERGAVAVEFALLVPLMVIILFAIIEFGIALTHTLAYASGAREGARYAGVNCHPEADFCTQQLIADRIEASVPAGYPLAFTTNPSALSVQPSADHCFDNPGELITVTWEETVPIDVPFLPDLSWTISPSGTFRCE